MGHTMKITLTNNFHGTSAIVRPVAIMEGRFAGKHVITRKTAQRLQRTLCGSSGCACGGNFGERGGVRLAVINEDYDCNYIIDMAASNV